MKKQEAMELLNKMGDGFEIKSKDGHFNVVKKTVEAPVAVLEKPEEKVIITIGDRVEPKPGFVDVKPVETGETLTIKQLAELLNLDIDTTYNTIRDKMNMQKNGSRWHFTPEQVNQVKEYLKK